MAESIAAICWSCSVSFLSSRVSSCANRRANSRLELAQLHEGSHHVDGHLHRASAVKDGGGYDCTVLSEGIGRDTADRRDLGQRLRSQFATSKQAVSWEIFRKAPPAPLLTADFSGPAGRGRYR